MLAQSDVALVLEQGGTSSRVPDPCCKTAAAEYKPSSLTFNLSVNLAIVQVVTLGTQFRPYKPCARPSSAVYYNLFLGAFLAVCYGVRVSASPCPVCLSM
jgi:hypothetical protein